MNRAYFVSCDPSNLLLRDAIDELRQHGRLIYETGGYNETSAIGQHSIVSVNNDTFWRGPAKIHNFARTTKSVLRTYTLQVCNYPEAQHDATYSARTNNLNLMEKKIRHMFKPVPVAEIMKFKAEFDRLFPPFVIREKLRSRNRDLKGELTVVEWNDGCISIIHHIICTVGIITETNEEEICVVANPYVAYYKINVKKPEDIEGEKCSLLLQLLERYRTEQLNQGREEEEEEEGPVDNDDDIDNDDDDNDDDENDDGDHDEEDLAHDLAKSLSKHNIILVL